MGTLSVILAVLGMVVLIATAVVYQIIFHPQDWKRNE